MNTRSILSVATLLLATSPLLLAHPGAGDAGFASGATHPLHGLDHLLAMVAVGILGLRCAQRPGGDRRALLLVPASFLGCLLLGGTLALAGVPLPGVEWGIALSVVALGLVLALATAPSLTVACAIAGGCAILHGHAHVAEMTSGNTLAYLGGMLLSTAALHALGLAGGWWLARAGSAASLRLAGVGCSLAGLLLVLGLCGG